MQLNILNRTAKLSIGEFSDFRIGPSQSQRRANRKRLEEGQLWHKELQKISEKAGKATDFEVPINITIDHHKWTLTFNGRMDQIALSNEKLHVVEVKTVNITLPCDPEILRECYRSYFYQLSAYGYLCKHSELYYDKDISGELLFVEVDSGITQRVILSLDEMEMHFKKQISCFYSFLQSRMLAKKHFHTCEVKLPYENFREGQPETIQALNNSSNIPIICLEAATGFGKTGIVLLYALTQLQNGLFDRILYLTGKSTGQLQVIKQLEALVSKDSGLNVFQLRSKSEHGLLNRVVDDEISIDDIWNKSGLSPQELFSEGKVNVDSIIDLANQIGIEPFEISKMLISYADVLICDYNYVFHPGVSSVLENTIGFDPEKTLIVIDEAHNLPSRVAGCFDHEFRSNILADVIMELQLGKASSKLIHSCKELADWISALPKAEKHSDDIYYKLKDLLIRLKDALLEDYSEQTLFSDSAKEILWELTEAIDTLMDPSLTLHYWSPNAQHLKISCLDASQRISQEIKSFGQSLLMSATLTPIDSFLSDCSLKSEDTFFLAGDSDWRKHAYDLAYDCRVDTRYKNRTKYYRDTADTALTLRSYTLNPVVVFFPSYAYAENILKTAQILEPGIRIALQPRNLDLVEQELFVRQSLMQSDLLFLVLGSSFSEGIDLLGGSVDTCMVVGPALPEVNPLQQAKMERVDAKDKKTAFRKVYQIPGMMKINQALGRLVRSPEHKAKVVLHCKRFSENSFQSLLDPVYQKGCVLHSTYDLNRWLSNINKGAI